VCVPAGCFPYGRTFTLHLSYVNLNLNLGHGHVAFWQKTHKQANYAYHAINHTNFPFFFFFKPFLRRNTLNDQRRRNESSPFLMLQIKKDANMCVNYSTEATSHGLVGLLCKVKANDVVDKNADSLSTCWPVCVSHMMNFNVGIYS